MAKMTNGQMIVASTKKKLVNFIAFEIPLLYKKLHWAEPEEGENYEVPTGDLVQSVFVNGAYFVEDRCYEDKEVEAIVLTPEGKIVICTEDDEIEALDITVDELAAVADAIERTYAEHFNTTPILAKEK